ncbi:MAG TPA: 4-vinyl reductase [Nitrososphaerales archaeon]|nr:4-vinyl reductase [Nitrososphaerales archaeon]
MGKVRPPGAPYVVDEDAGIITGDLLASRVVVFGSYGWATIESELNSTFVTGGLVILQRMGYSYGKYIGLVVKRNAGKLNPVTIATDQLVKIIKGSGWGDFSLTGGDLAQGVLRFLNKDCLFCAHLSKGREPKCHFLAGVLAGLADEVTGNSHTAREEKCIAKDDGACEFVVERTAQAQEPAPV